MDMLAGIRSEVEPQRTSEILERLAKDVGGGDTNVGVLLDGMKERGFGLIIFLFSLPNAILPIAWILGTPVLFFSAQLALGYREPWLPSPMRRAGIGRDSASKLLGFTTRYLQWMEGLAKPRLMWLTMPFMERIIGAYLVFLTLVLLVPIVPFGNALPAFGLGIMAVGILERDGLALIIGALIGAVGATYVFLMLGGAYVAFKSIFGF